MSKYMLSFSLMLLLVCLGCMAKEPQVTQAAEKQPTAHTAQNSREVTFTGVGGFKLDGTLLLPNAPGRHSALLLLPGSGPSDRDGNQTGLQINILKELAEKLAENGVATLRFDKRAVGTRYHALYPKDKSALNDFFSWEAFVGDAEAAFKFLQSQPEIDPKSVGVLGHSEGGIIALAMAKDVDPAALVLVSTPGRDLGDLIVEQIGQGYSSKLVDPATLKKYVDESKQAVDVIRTTGKVPDGIDPKLAPNFPSYASKYLHSLFTFEPTSAAKDYHHPVLIVQGEKDIQVSVDRDAPKLFAAFAPGQAELYKVPNATHCMKQFKGDLDPGFNGPVLPAVLDKVSAWSKDHLGR